jgi:hypothetical protein
VAFSIVGRSADGAEIGVELASKRCVVSVDTDFGELLAVGNHADPSVVLLRRTPTGRRIKLHS